MESYCSSWALAYVLTTVIESTPICETKIENSGQKDLRDVKAGQVCVALYQPLMHLGWLCASSKAKERPEMIKVYISYVFVIAYSPGSLYSLWCSNQTESVCSSCVNINNSFFY